MNQVTPISPNDVFLWPDGTWCTRRRATTDKYVKARREKGEPQVLAADSAEWATFMKGEGQ